MFSPPNFRPILCLATIPSCSILGNTRGTDNRLINSRALHPRDRLKEVTLNCPEHFLSGGAAMDFKPAPKLHTALAPSRLLILSATHSAFQVSRTRSTRFDLKVFRVLSKKDALECFIVPSFTRNLTFIE